jgi:hypothetical protein
MIMPNQERTVSAWAQSEQLRLDGYRVATQAVLRSVRLEAPNADIHEVIRTTRASLL